MPEWWKGWLKVIEVKNDVFSYVAPRTQAYAEEVQITRFISWEAI
jgi:negative regulator of replication initiation